MSSPGFHVSALLAAFVLSIVILSCSSSTGVDDDVADEDGISPSGIVDLSVVAFTNESVTISWTAPGDDSTDGTATAYDVRFSDMDDLWTEWDSATVFPSPPAPGPAGSAETLTVTGLIEDSTYFFAVRTVDDEDNWSFVSNVVQATCYNDFTVNIPDAGLESAVREAISKPAGDLHKSDLLGLEFLEAEEMGIQSLSGLEYCTRMHALIIIGNEIDDLSPLAGLAALRSLNAGYNAIADVSPLAGLTGLEQLALNENDVGDITSLANLNKMKTLQLQGNLITDVSALGNMADIGYLELSWNEISEIGPLAANSGLGSGDVLRLNVNPLSFESVTVHIPALQARGVDVSWTVDETAPGEVDDLLIGGASANSITLIWTAPGDDGIFGTADAYEVRYGTDSLEVAGWDGAAIATGPPTPREAGSSESMEVGGLETDTRYFFALKTRDEGGNWSGISNTASGTPFVDVVVVFPDAGLESAIREGLGLPSGDIHKSDLFGMLELSAAEKGISDLTGLEYCVNLDVLDLHGNSITGISALADLKRLTDLNLDDNSLTDIGPLAGHESLWRLSIRYNDITSLEPLAGLADLEYLLCSGNSIENLEPLSDLTSLFYFEALDNEISDISALSGLTFLSYIFLSINPVSDLGPLAGLTGLRYVYADYASVSDLSPLSGLPAVERVSVRYNQVTDIAPLVANANIGSGDEVWLDSNPLSAECISTQIPALVARGVIVHY